MLKFWSVINCIFVNWTKKLTLTCLSKNIEIETGISLDLLKAINVPWPDITFFVATATLAKVLQTMRPDYLLACIWIFILLQFLKWIFILHSIQHAHIDDIQNVPWKHCRTSYENSKRFLPNCVLYTLRVRNLALRPFK